MQDDREDVGRRYIFVRESFHLGHSLLFCDRGAGDLEDGDGNNRDQRGVHGDLGDQRCSWRRVWEGAEF